MENSYLSETLKIKFQNLIINWAKNNLIKYPWRKNRTPYRVLISEVLLTRTKAPQVEPVFIKFMEKYPTLEDFLGMNLDTVKNLIKSLGLSFRSQMINDIAQNIKSKYKKRIPDNFSDLKSLNGIGDYCANAILCFAFKQKRPLLDSNFIRIYNKLFNIKPKTKTAKSDKYLWEFSEYLLPDKDYINFNYGILDLGGKICLNKNPKCEECPTNNICIYFNRIVCPN